MHMHMCMCMCFVRGASSPFAQQHLKLHGPPNSGRSVAEWAPSLKRVATDACVLASKNASPAQRGPRRDAQPLHATPLAAVLFPAPLRATCYYFFELKRKKTDNPREGWEDGTPPPHRDFKERCVVR